MTIEIRAGQDMFASGAQALVAPVNCLGVHGNGLAKEFARRYPEACRRYTKLSNKMMVIPGAVVRIVLPAEPVIYFFATKEHWKDPSRLEWVSEGLDHLRGFLRETPETSIAVPALGAGLGGLAWKDVLPMILGTAKQPDVQAIRWLIYPPHEDSHP